MTHATTTLAALPHTLPACPNARVALFAFRRMGAHGLADARAAHALFTAFGESFRRPLMLVRAPSGLKERISRMSRRTCFSPSRAAYLGVRWRSPMSRHCLPTTDILGPNPAVRWRWPNWRRISISRRHCSPATATRISASEWEITARATLFNGAGALPGATATVRSQQTSESTGQGSATPSGVPGAASNQPPAQAAAPINGASAPLQAANSATTGGTSRRDAVTNYEVDKTVRVTRSATGNIRRLTAAVVLNHRTVTDAKGKTTTQPIPQEELDKLTALVRESIGADDKRGDSIKVINTPFQVPKEDVDNTPIWKQPETVDLIRTLAVPGALTLAALIVVFGAIRPAIHAAKPQPKPEAEANRLNASVDDALELPAIAGGNGPIVVGADGQELPALGAPGTDQRLETARQLAKDNPMAMANLVRGWMNN